MLREIGKKVGRVWKKNEDKGKADGPTQLEPTSRDDDGSLISFLRDSMSINDRRDPQKRVTWAASSPPSLEASSNSLARDETTTNQQTLISLREIFQDENRIQAFTPRPPGRRVSTPGPLQERARGLNDEHNRPQPSAPTRLVPMHATIRTTARVDNPTTSRSHNETQIENDTQM